MNRRIFLDDDKLGRETRISVGFDNLLDVADRNDTQESGVTT